MKILKTFTLTPNTIEVLKQASKNTDVSMSELIDALMGRMLSGLNTEQIKAAVDAHRQESNPKQPREGLSRADTGVRLNKGEEACMWAYRNMLNAHKEHVNELQRGRHWFSLEEFVKAAGLPKGSALLKLRGCELKGMLWSQMSVAFSGKNYETRSDEEFEHWTGQRPTLPPAEQAALEARFKAQQERQRKLEAESGGASTLDGII